MVKLLELQKSRNYEKSNPLELFREAGVEVETKILRRVPFLTNKWGKSVVRSHTERFRMNLRDIFLN